MNDTFAPPIPVSINDGLAIDLLYAIRREIG
jgi:hypothetical protein